MGDVSNCTQLITAQQITQDAAILAAQGLTVDQLIGVDVGVRLDCFC